MIGFARMLARLVSFVLLVVLAVAGLAAAVFCISGGTSGASLANLAHLVRLDDLRDAIGGWLGQLEGSGPVAGIAALCGIGAVLLGLLLLVGLLVPRRERLVTLEEDESGTLAARRRSLAHIAATLAQRARGVTDARARVRAGRRSGGKLRVRATQTRPSEGGATEAAVREQLGELTGTFALSPRVKVVEREPRVQ